MQTPTTINMPSSSTTHRQSTILIVDDDPNGREVLEDLLIPQGYRVISAVDGYEAIEKAIQFTPDLVLLDVMMPGMDGYEVCQQLRLNNETAEIPILMITALDDRSARLWGIQAGADEFISKPFDRFELTARVRTITRLNRYRTIHEERQHSIKQAGELARQLEIAYDLTLEGWSRALDLRDKETEGHSQRVTELTVQLARRLEVPDSSLIHIRRGALLHDIGKLGVPDQILHKPGPLTDEEWVIMRRHPEMGRDLLAPIDFLAPALDIPLSHHERWDGSGYPYGLRGEAIPLAARIFAVVDVWDALIHDRPYRRAWSLEQARQYIADQAGTQFDPRIAAALLEMV